MRLLEKSDLIRLVFEEDVKGPVLGVLAGVFVLAAIKAAALAEYEYCSCCFRRFIESFKSVTETLKIPKKALRSYMYEK